MIEGSDLFNRGKLKIVLPAPSAATDDSLAWVNPPLWILLASDMGVRSTSILPVQPACHAGCSTNHRPAFVSEISCHGQCHFQPIA
jgi:hypothetical protein